jgi:hypothetical protein
MGAQPTSHHHHHGGCTPPSSTNIFPPEASSCDSADAVLRALLRCRRQKTSIQRRRPKPGGKCEGELKEEYGRIGGKMCMERDFMEEGRGGMEILKKRMWKIGRGSIVGCLRMCFTDTFSSSKCPCLFPLNYSHLFKEFFSSFHKLFFKPLGRFFSSFPTLLWGTFSLVSSL